MGSQSDWFCWEIMLCKNPENCPAKKNPEKPCWETASEHGSDMHLLNVCRDCIVRLVKERNPLVSNRELFEIMKIRTERSVAIKLFENL
jgi:hypothetical protein